MANAVERGPRLTTREIERAKEIWEAYQKSHDMTPWIGQMAVIDPRTARIWIGKTWQEIAQQHDQEGINTPTFAVTVGKDYYVRKGGSR